LQFRKFSYYVVQHNIPDFVQQVDFALTRVVNQLMINRKAMPKAIKGVVYGNSWSQTGIQYQ